VGNKKCISFFKITIDAPALILVTKPSRILLSMAIALMAMMINCLQFRCFWTYWINWMIDYHNSISSLACNPLLFDRNCRQRSDWVLNYSVFLVRYPGFDSPPSMWAYEASVWDSSNFVPCPPTRLGQFLNIFFDISTLFDNMAKIIKILFYAIYHLYLVWW